ncbi:MAG: hypothetical protein ACOCRO_03240 [Halanaerobiales bacterium]
MNDEKKIACLDADIIIKMSHNDLELLEDVVDFFNECYLHDQVYHEIEWPEETVDLLDKLIDSGDIKLITDRELFKRLEVKRLFIDSLQQVCEIFGITFIYSDLEKYINNENKFFNKLHEADENIDENLGEIRTLQMIILLREIEMEKINYFISDDRRARNAIVLKYGSTLTEQKLYGVSLISSFYFLKNNGFTKNRLLNLVEKFSSSESKILYEKNRMDKMDNREIINNLYDGKLKLLKNGDFLLIQE